MGRVGRRCLAGCQPGRSPRLVPGPGGGAAVPRLPRGKGVIGEEWLWEEWGHRCAGVGGVQGSVFHGESALPHPTLAGVEQGAGCPTAP